MKYYRHEIFTIYSKSEQEHAEPSLSGNACSYGIGHALQYTRTAQVLPRLYNRKGGPSVHSMYSFYIKSANLFKQSTFRQPRCTQRRYQAMVSEGKIV